MNGPQKAGDRYNYDVAAFLKTNVFEYSPGVQVDLRKYSFDAAPNSFPPIATSFNQKISIDLIISTSDVEYLCECKYSDTPRPIRLNSKEFKESLLQFIGLEEYRIRQPRIVRYMTITNRSIKHLEKEISDLKRNFEKMRNYSKKLHNQGKRKWSSFESEIDIESIPSVLDNLFLIKIEKGSLREVGKERHFQEALTEIVRNVERKSPKRVPIALATRAHLRLGMGAGEDSYLEKKKLGYDVEISAKILDQILEYENSLQGDIVRASAKQLPFLEKCRVSKTQEMPIDEVARIITETINDFVEERLKILSYIAFFFPNLFEMYFVKTNCASKIVDSFVSPPTGRYSLMKRNELAVSIPPYVSILLITETRRLINGTIVDLSRIDKN